MDLYKELGLTNIRSEPSVWVSRLVILERITPDPVEIRNIQLTRGLNIIWAEETEDDNPAAEIGGHSAGKTTFCRLLRYVLGEKTFGTKGNMELMGKCLLDGYVGAELHVNGKKWAVRRPFGSGRMSYVKQDVTIDELLNERGESVSQFEYPRKVGLESLLDNLATGAVVRTGETIEWGHLLAWCTRDQEARFQNIHEWRSPRSESEAPAFRFPKGGPLFVMRAALGLFLPNELKGEERLAKLQQEKERLEKAIEEKRREPQFFVNHYDTELRSRLKTLLPDEQDIETLALHSDDLLPDLHRLTEVALSEIRERIQNCETDRNNVQNQIDEVGAEIRHYESDLMQLDVLFDLKTAVGVELDLALSGRQELRQKLKEHEDKICPFGDVLFRDCDYVIARQETLQITQIQDVKAMELADAKRNEEMRKIAWTKSANREAIQKLENQRQKLLVKRESLRTEASKRRNELHDLTQARAALEEAIQRRDDGRGYLELSRLRGKLNETDREIEQLEKELVTLLRQHDDNRELLRLIFSAAVRSVLSSGTYDGEIALDNRELAFRITHGPAMTGEAVETLSVLLADVASVIYNTASETARLPGLMLHDSPREADLGGRIYRSFIRFIASLVQHYGKNENCPFQYILTTTTAPPKKLQTSEYVKLRLDASKLQGLLLGRNIAEPPKCELTLFNGEQ